MSRSPRTALLGISMLLLTVGTGLLVTEHSAGVAWAIIVLGLALGTIPADRASPPRKARWAPARPACGMRRRPRARGRAGS